MTFTIINVYDHYNLQWSSLPLPRDLLYCSEGHNLAFIVYLKAGHMMDFVIPQAHAMGTYYALSYTEIWFIYMYPQNYYNVLGAYVS